MYVKLYNVSTLRFGIKKLGELIGVFLKGSNLFASFIGSYPNDAW